MNETPKLNCWVGCVARIKVPPTSPGAKHLNGWIVTCLKPYHCPTNKVTAWEVDVVLPTNGDNDFKHYTGVCDRILVPLATPGDDEVDEVETLMSEKANAKKILEHNVKTAEELLKKLRGLPAKAH